jgi:hypothetical protein
MPRGRTGATQLTPEIGGMDTTMSDPPVTYLADHGIWLAIPAFLPALIVVGVVLYVAMRNRRSSDKKQD